MVDATFLGIPVKDLVPTKHNPRTIREYDPAVEDLARSIEAMGVLEPVLVRPLPKRQGKYELLAGARRVRAAKIAGLDSVPAIVREVDDETAMEITVTENLHRDDLTPLEESRGIRTLLDGGWEVSAIADKLGKAVAWVYRRAQLMKLSDLWKAAVANPETSVSVWPATHLELIASLAPETQDLLAKEWSWRQYPQPLGKRGDFEIPRLAELKAKIAEATRLIRKAAWKVDDETLLPKAGSCSICKKRSSQERYLFEELDDAGDEKAVKKIDRCLDQVCWDAKQEAFLKRRQAELKAEHGKIALVMGTGALYDKNDNKRGVLSSRNYSTCKKTDKGAIPALVIRGAGAGTVRWITTSKGSSGSSASSGPKGDGTPTPLKERRARYDARRDARVVHAVVDMLDDGKQVMPALTPYQVYALAATFGTNDNCDSRRVDRATPWTQFQDLVDGKAGPGPERLVAMLVAQIVPVLQGRLHMYNNDDAADAKKEAAKICSLMGWEMKPLEDTAIAENPYPKSWANLNADGTPRREPQGRTTKKKANAKPATAAPKPTKKNQAKKQKAKKQKAKKSA